MTFSYLIRSLCSKLLVLCRGQDGESHYGLADNDQGVDKGVSHVADEARLADWHTGFQINHVSRPLKNS
jgi:hypothetical protein